MSDATTNPTSGISTSEGRLTLAGIVSTVLTAIGVFIAQLVTDEVPIEAIVAAILVVGFVGGCFALSYPIGRAISKSRQSAREVELLEQLADANAARADAERRAGSNYAAFKDRDERLKAADAKVATLESLLTRRDAPPENA